jgi:hypothetical protein
MLTITKICRRAPRPYIALQRVTAYIREHESGEHACYFQQNSASSKRPSPIRTHQPQPRTPTPNIANLHPRTLNTTTIPRHNTTLRLQQIIHLHIRPIVQHSLRDRIPKGSVQGAGSRPSAGGNLNGRSIDGASVVFELPDGARPGEGFRDVGDVRLDAGDGEGFGVDLVELVAGIIAG